MNEELDARLRNKNAASLESVLEYVHALSNTQDIPPGEREALLDRLTKILVAITDPDLLALLRDRLGEVTLGSHPDFIAIAHPSVVQLKRRTARFPNEHAEIPEESPSQADLDAIDEYRVLLVESEAEASYNIGDFVVEQNPYLLASQFRLRETDGTDLGSLDTAIDSGLGGVFAGRNSYGPWKPNFDGFPHIPHPDEPPHKTWYFVTGHRPADLPDVGTAAWNLIKDRARNVVKTVEIEYEPDINSGEPPDKPPHLILLFAGGNGT